MFNKFFFSKDETLRYSRIFLAQIIFSCIYAILLFISKGHVVLQSIISIVFTISTSIVTLIPMMMDMVSETRRVNKWLKNKDCGFNLKEKEYPKTLIYSISEGYYKSPNRQFLTKIRETYAEFNENDLDQTIWELQYHLNKGRSITPTLTLAISCIGLLGLNEVSYKYFFQNFSNVITVFFLILAYGMMFIYYIKVNSDKKAFLNLLINMALAEKQKRSR